MTHAVIQQLLDGIVQRERELAEQIGELAARLREAQAEREALATAAKTVHAMAVGLHLEQPQAPVLPDGAAYQQIMDVFEHERRPLRARDLCLAWIYPWCPSTSRAPAQSRNAWSASVSSTRPNPGCSNSPACRRRPRLQTSKPDPSQW
ncbi:hypothetical protein [Streptomyces sp. NPDC093149]|uniref:hypothetical protein n=1 Tax=Streptomyces sp. NPDC093149 TaxID=3366031 RepID=UPI0038047D31